MNTLRLGLIGGNITQSQSPALQIVCGLSVGLNVSYDLLVPEEQALSFGALFKRCASVGFDGVNVTYPYKEEVMKYCAASSGAISDLGAANTVKFSNGAKAWNTDCSGFVAAFQEKFGKSNPGRVLLLGAGGVGRAIAFALAELGSKEIVLHDIDGTKADGLSKALKSTKVTVVKAQDLLTVADVTGIVNCTPLGMDGVPGSALPLSLQLKPSWAFDAVYTPENTEFMAQCENLGAAILPGYELYFHQGVQGFKIFSGVEIADFEWIRKTLRR